MKSKDKNYIDLFAGCGGLSLGLQKSGWKGIFAIEKNKDAFETFKTNLIDKGNHFEWPDFIEKKPIDIKELLEEQKDDLSKLSGKVALVVGGPPCQGFSMAGKRDLNDIRNTLVKSYIEFIKIIMPEMLFLENVHGFTIGFEKNGKKGKPYSQYVAEKLTKLGYNIKSKVIDVSEYGVPQKRKRFILVGMLNKNPEKFFDKLENNRKDFLEKRNLHTPITISEAIGDLLKSNGTYPTPDAKGFFSGRYGEISSDYQRLMRKNTKVDDIVDSHRYANHRQDSIELFTKMINTIQETKRITPKSGIIEGLKKRGVTVLKEDSICTTVTSIPDDFVHYSEPRIMSVREMARIQSFPDDYEFKGKYTTGGKLRKVDVPRYTQVANAVPPLFAEQVGIVLGEML